MTSKPFSSLPPYRRWYRYRAKSPGILVARLRNKWQPIFRLRMAWQRAMRGYSDEQCWNLNYALAKLIVVGVSQMREWGHGYPAEFAEYGDVSGPEHWDDILRRIEEGFQLWIDEDGWFQRPEEEEKFKEALALLSEWFGALWD